MLFRSETEYYNAGVIIQQLTINKGAIADATLPSQTIPALTNTTIVTIVNDINGNIVKGTQQATIKIGNNEYTTTINNGLLYATIPADKLQAGTYTITVTIPESEYYKEGTITQQITINKRIIANVTLPTASIGSLTNYTLIIQVNDTDGNPIEGNIRVPVKVNGKTQLITTMTNGLIYVTIPTDTYIQTRNYTMTIEIPENNYYTAGIITQKIEIKLRQATINATVEAGYVFENIIVRVKVLDNQGIVVNNGFVIFKVNGKTLRDAEGNTIIVNVKNGEAVLNYTPPNSWRASGIGNISYTLKVQYNGQGIYESTSQENIGFELKQRPVILSIPTITVYKGTNTTLELIVKDMMGKQLQDKTSVAVKINGVTQAKTVMIDGVLNITIPTSTLGVKTYPAELVIGQTSIYSTANVKFTIKVENPPKTVKTTTIPTTDNTTVTELNQQLKNTTINTKIKAKT